jgi:hypothetical protein
MEAPPLFRSWEMADSDISPEPSTELLWRALPQHEVPSQPIAPFLGLTRGLVVLNLGMIACPYSFRSFAVLETKPRML